MKYWYIYNYIFDSRSSFMVTIYNISIYAIYIFMPIIYIIELFIGIDGDCYSIYILVYYHYSLII